PAYRRDEGRRRVLRLRRDVLRQVPGNLERHRRKEGGEHRCDRRAHAARGRSRLPHEHGGKAPAARQAGGRASRRRTARRHDERARDRREAEGGRTMTATAFARTARREDAAEIARIYNEGIEDRVATFETELRGEKDVLRWFEEERTLIVVEQDGHVPAFASAFGYRPRRCYDGVREFSVYVSRDARGKGLGAIALKALFAAARARG